ncbi:12297_t:CDS:2, partial [Funneliformis caledonium]
PKFWNPQNCHDDDIKPTLWQLHLYPNGDLGARNYISVSLEAIKTPFERSNNINEREQRHKLGIGKTFVNRSSRSKTHQKVTDIKYNYNFNNPPATWILKGMRFYTKKPMESKYFKEKFQGEWKGKKV